MHIRRMLVVPLVLILCISATPVTEPAAAKEDKDRFKPAAPVQLSKDGEKWAQRTLKKLSVEEKVGQLIMVRALAEFQNEQSPAFIELRDQLKKFHIGSVIITVRVDGPLLLRNQPYEAAMMTNRLQQLSALPLLVAADFERGLSMRLLATPFFPHAMAFGAAGKPEYSERFAKVVARESRAVGVHWNFFPVADVNSNPQNPIINTRSYGEDPKLVGEMSAAYIKGSREGGMLSTAKHFPGHGDTSTDSHLELAKVGGDMARINSIELPPFQQAIDAGVDSVMIAHVTIPALEPDPNKVATTSSKVVTDLLINQMKFNGLVVTDAMDMRALTNVYKSDAEGTAAGKAAVDAFKAGNDMILLPSDVEGAYNGMVAAAKSGVITQEELDKRVLKVLKAKASLGLWKKREVDIDAVAHLVAKPEDLELAQTVANEAITLAKNDGQALDLLLAERRRRMAATQPAATPAAPGTAPEPGVVALVVTDDLRRDSGRVFERELRARIPNVRVFSIDGRVADSLMEPVTEAVINAKAVVIATFAVPSAGRSMRLGGTGGGAPAVLKRVFKIAAPKTVLVALGNPYVGGDYPDVQTYMCTFSDSPTSEVAAVKALFGEIPTRGKLPVTLPGIGQRGAGIERNLAARNRVEEVKDMLAPLYAWLRQ